MLTVYVGDSKDVSLRIKKRHCTGNVKTSVFRQHIANRMNFPIKKEPKVSRKGNVYTSIYIDLPNRRAAEKQVSNYVAEGKWKYVICDSKAEAQDFQYYVIQKLDPKMNILRLQSDKRNGNRYTVLFGQLMNCGWLDRATTEFPNAPGVYVYGNTKLPED